jgi:Fe-S cluster assembly iron-binding protein IscA
MAVIQVTPPAAERIRALLDKEGKLESHALRLKVVGGGCSGLRYELAFDERVNENWWGPPSTSSTPCRNRASR